MFSMCSTEGASGADSVIIEDCEQQCKKTPYFIELIAQYVIQHGVIHMIIEMDDPVPETAHLDECTGFVPGRKTRGQ